MSNILLPQRRNWSSIPHWAFWVCFVFIWCTWICAIQKIQIDLSSFFVRIHVYWRFVWSDTMSEFIFQRVIRPTIFTRFTWIDYVHWSPVVSDQNRWNSLKKLRMKTHIHLVYILHCYCVFTFDPHRVFWFCFVFFRSCTAGYGNGLICTSSIECQFMCRWFVIVRTQLVYMIVNKSRKVLNTGSWNSHSTHIYLLGIP